MNALLNRTRSENGRSNGAERKSAATRSAPLTAAKKPRPKKKASSQNSKLVTKRQSRLRTIRRIAISIVAIALAGAIISSFLYIIYNDSYQVSSLVVETNDPTTSLLITDYTKDYLNQDSYLIPYSSIFFIKSFGGRNMNQTLKNQFPNIENVTTEIVNNEVLIKAVLMESTANWCSINKNLDCFSLASNGRLIGISKKSKNTLMTFVPTIVSDNINVIGAENKFVVGDYVLDPYVLDGVTRLLPELNDLDYGLDLIEVHLSAIKIIFKDSPNNLPIKSVLLPINTAGQFEQSMGDFIAVVKDGELDDIKVTNNIDYFELVDFTSPDKVFYSFKLDADN